MEPVVIALPERFNFDARPAFRAAYRGRPVPPGGYIIDFQRTHAVDSAGLGLLLQLLEYAGERREAVRLVHVQPAARELLVAAGFPAVVTLE